MNFGSNAIKYNRPGGQVTFTVSASSPDRVRVAVADTGIGIPANKQHLVFQPFQRAGQESGPIEGTGIGLAITKRLAELMQGDVGFRSQYGEGSEFWVEMPAHESRTRSTIPPTFHDVVGRLGEQGEALILYVEDNPANVTFMQDLLGAFENIELVVARTAEEGVAIAQERLPRVVIMDINLPGMDGLAALRILRDHPGTTAIPVIAVTAAATDRDRRRGEAAGFYRYLTKPLKVADLEAVLEALVAQPNRSAG
jgi:CheY-like chemotaxis protein